MNKSETNTDENFPDNIPPSNTGDAETPAAYLYSEEKQPDEETLNLDITKSITPAILNPDMEVHHHGHVHEKKKWKEYVFQFLMLFLAITLGFFVENQREHYIEKLRAKEYAHALYLDIIQDTLELARTIMYYREDIGSVDSLFQSDKETNGHIPTGLIYFCGSRALTAYRLSFNDATLQQLKSSGNLRYFRILKLKEKVSTYDNIAKTFLLRQDIELTYIPEILSYAKLFDYSVSDALYVNRNNRPFIDSFVKANPPLLINDPVVIKQFLGFCYDRKRNWNSRITRNLLPILQQGRELIAMLNKEYHFEGS